MIVFRVASRDTRKDDDAKNPDPEGQAKSDLTEIEGK
jgi:hypothetical protein